MNRSYLAVRHLLRQLELKRERELGKQIIPEWFSSFVDSLSELFEPFKGVARVGYECAYSEGTWEISIFLGETEVVGGADDGQMIPVNFRFDLAGIPDLFDTLESIHWNAFPNNPQSVSGENDLSFITINGTVAGDSVLLQIQATPPAPVGPAMKKYHDGRLELA